MKKLPKCEYCNKPLNINDCVFIHMVKWYKGERNETSIQICTECYVKEGERL